ncbi:hypothetical protein FGRMN_6982 [Fusarium graminum]|nr:hypothetical protein FGRMN_6982 [Fusarium graminum]
MRKSTPYQLALFMASVATAADTSTCAIDCFQGLITNGPPAQCKEATNYLCFCTMPAPQDNFMQCVDKTCSSEKDTATAWAGELCAKLGKPIDLGTPQDPPKTDATTAVDVPATSVSEIAKPSTEAGKATESKSIESKTTEEAAPTTTAAAETTEPKADRTPTTETSQAPSETTAVGAISNSTMTSIGKPKDTTKSDASGDAAETTSDKSTGDKPVVTLTGTANSASATASESSSAENDSNAASSIVTSGLFTSVGIAVALWQLL